MCGFEFIFLRTYLSLAASRASSGAWAVCLNAQAEWPCRMQGLSSSQRLKPHALHWKADS